MRTGLDDVWSEWVASRGAVDALLDVWHLTVVAALVIGIVLGYASRP
jgi:hypothetical protein